MGIAVTFWPFGGKASGTDTATDSDVDVDAEVDAGGGAAPSLRQRLHAWWEGSDAVANQDADSNAEPDADSNAGASLRERLHAWWEGYDLAAAPKPESGPKGEPSARSEPGAETGEEAGEGKQVQDVTPPEPGKAWNEKRITLAEDIWGSGIIWPGGIDYIYELVNGFSLDPTVSMIEIGAGLGAESRAVVEKFGAYVTALECSPELVQEGRKQNTVCDVDDKVTLEVLDPKQPRFKERYFVGALVRDAFLNIENKDDLLSGVIQSLKPEGQIVITSLLYDEDADGPEIEAWKDIEPDPVYPWSVGDIKNVFASEKVLLRIANDDSDTYRSMVLSAWSDFMHKVKAREVEDELMGMLLWEAELWARRLAAMETGQLQYHRIVGIKNH